MKEHPGRSESLSAKIQSERLEKTLPGTVEDVRTAGCLVRHEQCPDARRAPVYGTLLNAECEHLLATRPADAIAGKVHRGSIRLDAGKLVAVGGSGGRRTPWQNDL